MIGLDWILLALVAGFVVTAGGASLFGRPRASAASARPPSVRQHEAEHRGLWSIAEAAWAGGRRPPLGRWPEPTSGPPRSDGFRTIRAALVQSRRADDAGATTSRPTARDDARRTARLLRARRMVDRW